MKIWKIIIGFCLSLASTIFVDAQATGQAPAKAVPQLIPGPLVQWGKANGGNGHYYRAIESPNGTHWDDARAYASAHGGYLATISSSGENDFVFNLIDDPKYWVRGSRGYSFGPWLGAVKSPTAIQPADGWKWANGEGPVTYFNWAPNQPDNSGGKETHILYYDDTAGVRVNKWNDCGTFAAHGFVVEYNSNPSPPPAPAPASGDMSVVVTMASIFALIVLIGVIVLVFRGKAKNDGRGNEKAL